MPAQTQTLELARYWKVLRRGWLVVILSGVIGLLAGAAYLATQPRVAAASTMVNVNVISSEPFNMPREPSGLIDPQTESQTARSSVVVARTAQELGGDRTPAEVRAALSAELEPDATVLRITYSADSPEEAVAGADEAARQFLAYRGQLAVAKVKKISDQLTQRRDLLRDDLLRVTQQLAKAPDGSGRAVQAESDRQLLNLELNSLLSQLNAMRGIDTTGGTILSSASDVGAYITPSAPTLLLVGLLAGLAGGLVLAFVRYYLDRRVRDDFTVLEAGGGPLLSVDARDGTDTSLDARPLREQLVVHLPDAARTVAVLDVAPDLGASRVALRLALAECDAGREVELILPGVAEAESFALLAELGPRGSATGNPAREQVTVVRYRDHPRLTVSCWGPTQPGLDAASLLDAHLSGKRPVDTTVVAVSVSAGRAVRLAAARLAHACVLVLSLGQARKAALRAAVADLDSVGADLAGSVIVPKATERPAVLSSPLPLPDWSIR